MTSPMPRSTTTQPSPAMARVIAQVRVKFLDRLDDDLRSVSKAISITSKGPLPNEEMADLTMRLHKISGMAQTLGFSRLGSSATDMQVRLERSRDSGEFGQGLAEALRSFADDVGRVLADGRLGTES